MIVNRAEFSFSIHSGKSKDYYLSIEHKYRGKHVNIMEKVLIGDNYEESAR